MRKEKQKTHNTWRGLVIALLLGFITTIFVAQLIAMFGNIDRYTIPVEPPAYRANHMSRYTDNIPPLFRMGQWLAPVENPKGPMYDYLNIGSDLVEYSYRDKTAGITHIFQVGALGTLPTVNITRRFVGLPFRCMYYDNFIISPGNRKEVIAYFDLMKDKAGNRTGFPSPGPTPLLLERRIPLALMWGGFLANTLFFGLLIYLSVAFPRSIRQRRRKRRGLCLACGYAVEDLEICPECGWAHATC